MKTQGILPRSEVTMEVRRCQCAHHCRVQMQSPNAQASDVEGGRRSVSVRWWKRERTRGIATIRDTNEGNASDTMHVWFQIARCQCSEGVSSTPVALLTGLPRFRLLRICRTYEDAFVSQGGPKMICSSREDPSVILRTLISVRG